MKINILVMGMATLVYAIIATILFGEDLFSDRGIHFLLAKGGGVLLITAIISAIPGVIFWLIKKRVMPYLFVVAWAVWLWGVGISLGDIILHL